MREAVGGTFLYYIVIFIVTVIMLLLVASIACSKAYRVNNRIVDVIEKYECYEESGCESVSEINNSLASIGYQIKKTGGAIGGADGCPAADKIPGLKDVNLGDPDAIGTVKKINSTDNNYLYCLYKVSGERGAYYKVVSYLVFEVPLIGGNIKIPIYGTTKSLYTNNGEV